METINKRLGGREEERLRESEGEVRPLTRGKGPLPPRSPGTSTHGAESRAPGHLLCPSSPLPASGLLARLDKERVSCYSVPSPAV